MNKFNTAVNNATAVTTEPPFARRVGDGLKSAEEKFGIIICATPYEFETNYTVSGILNLMLASSKNEFNIVLTFRNISSFEYILQYCDNFDRSLGIDIVTPDKLIHCIKYMVDDVYYNYDGDYENDKYIYSDEETIAHLNYNHAHDQCSSRSYIFIDTTIDEITPMSLKIAQQFAGVSNYYDFKELHSLDYSNVNIWDYNHQNNHNFMLELLNDKYEDWEESLLYKKVVDSRHPITLLNNACVIYEDSHHEIDLIACVSQAYEEYETIINSDIGSLAPEQELIEMLRTMIKERDIQGDSIRFNISDDIVASAVWLKHE
jgi:hypothetical protein